MAVKYPYEDLMCDERSKVMSGTEGGVESYDEYMQDRNSGINADPSEGPRDGVTSVKRMNPNHYIRNGGSK